MCKILVIDDEKVIVSILQQLLEKFGHDVETAADGSEGIQKFDNDCFDMVITDICMPGVDGNSVAKHIRSSDKNHMPVIGMSGTPWVFENYSFDTILEKPFQLKALINSVEELLPIHTKAVAFG